MIIFAVILPVGRCLTVEKASYLLDRDRSTFNLRLSAGKILCDSAPIAGMIDELGDIGVIDLFAVIFLCGVVVELIFGFKLLKGKY